MGDCPADEDGGLPMTAANDNAPVTILLRPANDRFIPDIVA